MRPGLHEEVIASYATVLAMARIALSQPAKIPQDLRIPEDRRAWYTRAWALLQRANIFEFDEAAYLAIHRAADVYVTTEVMRLPWTGTSTDNLEVDALRLRQADQLHTEEERTQRWLAAEEVGMRVEFPGPLPFPVSYLAYGRGVVLGQVGKLGRRIDDRQTVRLLGHLVAEGTVAEVLVSGEDVTSPGYASFWINCLYGTWGRDTPGTNLVTGEPVTGPGWANCVTTLAPWVVRTFMSFINSHRTVIDETRRRYSLGDRLGWKKRAKRSQLKMPVPPPYYVVHMKDEFLRDLARRPSLFPRKIQWQHRWSVRAHDVVRFQRGPLPLDPKLGAKLKARRYRIFTVEPPDVDTWRLLAERRIPAKGADEWMAVLVSRRRDFVKGPQDAPLVPSVRRSAKRAPRDEDHHRARRAS